MAGGKDQTNFVLLGEFTTELNAVAEFEFGIAVVIKSKCGRSILKAKVGVEKEWIFVDDFGLVAALRDFRRNGNGPAVAEHVPIPVLSADDSAFECPIADRDTEFLALSFFGRNV